MKEEIGDDEVLTNAMRMRTPNVKLLALQQKYGLVSLPALSDIAHDAKGARR